MEKDDCYANSVLCQLACPSLVHPDTLCPTVNTKFPKDRRGYCLRSTMFLKSAPHALPMGQFVVDWIGHWLCPLSRHIFVETDVLLPLASLLAPTIRLLQGIGEFPKLAGKLGQVIG